VIYISRVVINTGLKICHDIQLIDRNGMLYRHRYGSLLLMNVNIDDVFDNVMKDMMKLNESVSQCVKKSEHFTVNHPTHLD
jgi:hypothetical protein